MKNRCPYCDELIVARGFGKCPGCHKDLPEELQLTIREKNLDEMDAELTEKRKELVDGIGYTDKSDGLVFPIDM